MKGFDTNDNKTKEKSKTKNPIQACTAHAFACCCTDLHLLVHASFQY